MTEKEELSLVRASSLDISAAAMDELSSQFLKFVTDYFTEIPTVPVFRKTFAGKTSRQFGSKLSLSGEPLADLLGACQSIIDNTRHNGHPRCFGYVTSPSTPVGAFADLLASTLNINVTSWRSSPAATEIEKIVISWLGSMIGYGENAHGLLTSGGSMANLIALQIAHRAKVEKNIDATGLWNAGPPMTIYASDQIHMSIPKAAQILGFGHEQVRLVECDDQFRLDPQRLRRRIENDLQNGFRPFCVVASAGTVNTGAVDPLNEIAQVAREFNLWFHIDGAYGAPASLDERKRPLFAGLEAADSISLDAHKWLYVPIDSGCLLFRDQETVRAAFSSADADYIKVLDPGEAAEAFAFWDYGMELSRRFRALKIWFTLQYYGLDRIAQAISDDNALATFMAELVESDQEFELMAPVELSICCFRFVPAEVSTKLRSAGEDERERIQTDVDDLNRQIMVTVQQSGIAYVSNATVSGRFALRACITNFRTTQRDIEKTLETVREIGRGLVGTG